MPTPEEAVALADQLLSLDVITLRQRQEVGRRLDEPDFVRQFEMGALLLGSARRDIMDRLLGPRDGENESNIADLRISHPIVAARSSAASDSPLTILGYWVAAAGLVLGFSALVKSTTVSRGYGLSETHNTGLIADREVLMMA